MKERTLISRKVNIKNPTGLNLRPAGLFCQTAMNYSSQVTFKKKGNGEDITANAKSVLSVLGASVRGGEEIELICEGVDQESAMEAMVKIIEEGLEE
jgi:phosphocarrier protein